MLQILKLFLWLNRLKFLSQKPRLFVSITESERLLVHPDFISSIATIKMNLHNYFTQQSKQYLPDDRKLALYENICYQRSGFSPSLKRSKILTKKEYMPSFLLYYFLLVLVLFSGKTQDLLITEPSLHKKGSFDFDL